MPYVLKQNLTLAISAQTSLHDVQITSECGHQLARMIQLGVEKMTLSKLLDTPDKRLLAEQNLVHFLELMENHSRDLDCYPILDEKVFEGAKSDIGILWPFFSTW